MQRYEHGYDDLTEQQLMDKVRRGWRSAETPCGRGSERSNARAARAVLEEVVSKFNITSIADAGAGDLHWMRRIDGVDYFPYDIYPRHPDVVPFDITKNVLPPVDLIFCRHVLNHLSIRMAADAIQNFKLSESKYIMFTTCKNQKAYWKYYGFDYGAEPIATFKDCQHWSLELYENCLR